MAKAIYKKNIQNSTIKPTAQWWWALYFRKACFRVVE